MYGASVTVSGLLSGRDFDRVLSESAPVDLVLIPANSLRSEDDLFLDDMMLNNLRERHPSMRLEAVYARVSAIVEAVGSLWSDA